MDDREDRIRNRAHQIWEEEGRPDGQEAEHWKRAVREIDGDTGEPDRAEGEQTEPLSTRSGSSGVSSGLQPSGTSVSTALQPSGVKPSNAAATTGTASAIPSETGASTAERPSSDLRRG